MYDPINITDLCKYAYFEFNASKTFQTSCEKGQQKKKKEKVVKRSGITCWDVPQVNRSAGYR